VRTTAGAVNSEAENNGEVIWGELIEQAANCMQKSVTNFLYPMVSGLEEEKWGSCEDENRSE